jgi:hypothetical protein
MQVSPLTRVIALTRAVLLTVALMLVQTQPTSAHYQYNGAGQWRHTSLTWCSYAASIYDGPTASAASSWNAALRLRVNQVLCGPEDIGTYSGDYGCCFDARTVICVVTGGCFSAIPINSDYSYVQIQYNSPYMSNMTDQLKQAIACHELGHSFSLFHVPDTNPPHIMYGDAAYVYRTFGIYYPTIHDLDGVNARY